jgi:starch-binding outer membrane protein, SusD/RagB family
MKNTFYLKNKLRLALLAPSLALSVMMTSCEKETMDLLPKDRITEASAFETAERIELSMLGVYDAAQTGFYSGAQRGYPFGAASIQQGDVRGEDMLNVAAFYAFSYESTFNATTTLNNVYMWETLYGLINKANIMIEGVQTAAAAGIISAEKAKSYEGEARFLRALAHHELLTHFARPYNHTADASHAGVPYRRSAINNPTRIEEAKKQGRHTVKESYAFLLEDLDFAENNITTATLTRASKGAAIALKTRVKLHMRDWSGVVTEANKIVTGTTTFTSPVGGYALTATPEGPFTGNKGNSESIFSILNSTDDNPGTNAALANMYSGKNRALVAISPVIWNQTFWPTDDKRRTNLALSAFGGEMYTTKYQDLTGWSDNTPVIRYAEVLLNKAEAHSRLNQPVEALALYKAVRGRSTSQIDLALVGDALTQAIINERRIEFVAEGLRWKDIHRLAKNAEFGVSGIPAKVAYGAVKATDWVAASGEWRPALFTSIPAIPYGDDRFLWPIPTSETTSNPVLKAQQNPGY